MIAGKSTLTVYLVDDDASVRDSLDLMLGLLGYRTASYESAEALLGAFAERWVGCVVADLRLPGKSGLELQAELRARGSRLPFILITAHGSTAAARSAFRLDAVDFLEKPFDDDDLRSAIDRCFKREAHRIEESEQTRAESRALSGLSPREREVLELVGRGLHAKEIARMLGISSRTVDVHKAHLMDKLGVSNTAGLIRLALMAEKAPERG